MSTTPNEQGDDWPFGLRVVLWSLCQSGLILLALGAVWAAGFSPLSLWALGGAMMLEALLLAMAHSMVFANGGLQ